MADTPAPQTVPPLRPQCPQCLAPARQEHVCKCTALTALIVEMSAPVALLDGRLWAKLVGSGPASTSSKPSLSKEATEAVMEAMVPE